MKARSGKHNGIYYEVRGAGDPLVLIHGHTLDARMWEPQLETFARYFQVICLDLRGYGRSDLPDLRPFRYAEDLRNLLEHLHIDKAHLLGLSLGGNVALDFALNYPESTNALLVAGSSLKGFPTLPEAAALLSAIPARAREAGVEAARALWLAHPFFEPALRNPKAAQLLQDIVRGYSGWHWMTGYPPSGPIEEIADRVGEIQAQTVVIIGEWDVPQHQLVAEHLATRIPDARKAVIRGAGHMVNLEAPEEFNQLVITVLRGHQAI
ncbi:alpha/beta fold hydrolase [Calidithermus roseus]|uniref:Carboxylesterase YbfK n=1 Tax=Calidithermus roseus TaxID=1644118 RepID=A0A399EWS9_9DEIN|nr:alpha/beta hydrolase [Calidithermus roseus]RIH87896.1 Carboxylesterase YbfK [Calidithermus roseus]